MLGHLICIGGLPGSGKTTIANALKIFMDEDAGIDVTVICPDKLRLKIIGKDPDKDVLTDADITDVSTYQVIKIMKEHAIALLRKGKTVIIGSAFVLESMREDYQTAAIDEGAMFTGIWLAVNDEARRDRMQRRLENYVNKKTRVDMNPSIIVSSKLTIDHIEGHMTWLVIDGGQSLDDVLAEVCNHLKIEVKGC